MKNRDKYPRYCTVRSSVRYGVYSATLVEAILDEVHNEILLKFQTTEGEIVRHSPVSSRNSKHGDLIRAIFTPDHIPESQITSGSRCVELLRSKIGDRFLVAYSRRDGQCTAGSLSVVPLHRGALSNVTTGKLGGSVGLSEGGTI